VSEPGPRPEAADRDSTSPASPLPDGEPASPAGRPEAPERRWVWMDRWDPGTWEMPSNPTKLQRVLAGIALAFIALMTLYLPLKILKIF
jgi:hypothetical protein